MKKVKIKYLENDSGEKKKMTMTVHTVVRSEYSAGKGRVFKVNDKIKMRDVACVSSGRRFIKQGCALLAETGSQVWYTTFTYAKKVNSGRVACEDLKWLKEQACVDKGDRFIGVIELSEDGDLHLHCLSSKEIGTEAIWNKGLVHSRVRYYNAERAGKYMAKQYGNGKEYTVSYRGVTKTFKGMEGFRKLWKNLPFAIMDSVTNSLVKDTSKTQKAEITEEQVEIGEGELFAVIKADLACLGKYELEALDVKGFRLRLNNLQLNRGRNGTLYANNNAAKSSPLVQWMIQNKKDVLVATFLKAKERLLLDYENNLNTKNKVL